MVDDYPNVDFDVDNVGAGAGGQGIASVHTTSFKDFLLKEELCRSIADCGFEHPSQVQQECLPKALIGQDVLCQAKSGMGKTAVFVLSILNQLPAEPKPCSALVLCHTRELAYQIKNEFARFTKHLQQCKTEVIYGGKPIKDHIKMFKDAPPTIVVGTPGRILDLVKRKSMKLDDLKTFVIDECDKVLESLDMRSDVQQIFKATPHLKQVMMYSATMTGEMKDTCRRFMRNPFEVIIDLEKKLTLDGLIQYYVNLQDNQKTRKLVELLDSLKFNQVVIFVKSAQFAIALDKLLQQESFPSTCFHSRMNQEERIRRYNAFKNFEKRIMVATDILGRGIDIEKINVVFNYDMPEDADSYLHRVGRAGRFGTKGLAISFISSPENTATLEEIQKRFEVKIKDLPAEIDESSYMNN